MNDTVTTSTSLIPISYFSLSYLFIHIINHSIARTAAVNLTATQVLSSKRRLQRRIAHIAYITSQDQSTTRVLRFHKPTPTLFQHGSTTSFLARSNDRAISVSRVKPSRSSTSPPQARASTPHIASPQAHNARSRVTSPAIHAREARRPRAHERSRCLKNASIV
jgi:hypothetical protein